MQFQFFSISRTIWKSLQKDTPSWGSYQAHLFEMGLLSNNLDENLKIEFLIYWVLANFKSFIDWKITWIFDWSNGHFEA